MLYDSNTLLFLLYSVCVFTCQCVAWYFLSSTFTVGHSCRFRKSTVAQTGLFVSVLPTVLVDFLTPTDAISSVIHEMLSPHQTHFAQCAELLSKVSWCQQCLLYVIEAHASFVTVKDPYVFVHYVLSPYLIHFSKTQLSSILVFAPLRN